MNDVIGLCMKIVEELKNGKKEEDIVSWLSTEYNRTPDEARFLVQQATNFMSIGN